MIIFGLMWIGANDLWLHRSSVWG